MALPATAPSIRIVSIGPGPRRGQVTILCGRARPLAPDGESLACPITFDEFMPDTTVVGLHSGVEALFSGGWLGRARGRRASPADGRITLHLYDLTSLLRWFQDRRELFDGHGRRVQSANCPMSRRAVSPVEEQVVQGCLDMTVLETHHRTFERRNFPRGLSVTRASVGQNGLRAVGHPVPVPASWRINGASIHPPPR